MSYSAADVIAMMKHKDQPLAKPGRPLPTIREELQSPVCLS